MARNGILLFAPASRGISRSFARHYLAKTSLPVIATGRNKLDDLRDSILDGLKGCENRLTVLPLDLTDETTIKAAKAQVESKYPNEKIRLFFSGVGVLYPEKSPQQMVFENIEDSFRRNVIGHMLLFKHFHTLLPRQSDSFFAEEVPGLQRFATWCEMSARVGSISDNRLGGWYSYRASKAALNSAIKSFDIFLRGRSGDRAMMVGMHPGTVKTDFSREFWQSVESKGQLFEIEDAVSRLTTVISNLELAARGKVWDWKGEEVPP